MMSLGLVVLVLAAVPVVACSAYLALLTALSRSVRPPERRAPHLRFDVVVPAHDEASGIATTVESLLSMDYPRALFRVVVIADNCTDDTAARATAAGALVLVRSDPDHRGKGQALAFAFERLLREQWSNAIAVVDADSVASPNLLEAFSARIDDGASAVQAHYGVLDPNAGWRPRLMTIAFATFHELRSRARERLGASSGLRGNGMAFTTDVLVAVPYAAFSIVEDVEQGVRLAQAGHRVRYAGEAHVLGAMTTSEHASRSQRRRWEGGRFALARAHVPGLLARGPRDRVAMDIAMDLLVPPLSTLALAITLGTACSLALVLFEPSAALVLVPWLASGIAVAAYTLRGWQISETGWRGLSALAYAPVYVAWKMTLRLRRDKSPKGAWVRTAREGEAR